MGRTYACADLHSNMNLYRQICNFIEPNDTVYFLGDAIDRGPDGFSVAEAIYNNPNWIYMIGNHEDMMVGGLLKDNLDDFYIWMGNGGRSTYDDFTSKSKEEQQIWLNRLDKLPWLLTYDRPDGTKVKLTHAGYTPNLSNINKYSLLWDRRHFLYSANEKNFGNLYVVHGHTPTIYLNEKILTKDIENDNFDPSDILIYNNGHKIDIDCGCHFTGKIALLDLDTFDVYYFYDKEN